jgi:hypothetical protein
MFVPVLQIVFLSQTGANAEVGSLLCRVAGGWRVLSRAGLVSEFFGS